MPPNVTDRFDRAADRTRVLVVGAGPTAAVQSHEEAEALARHGSWSSGGQAGSQPVCGVSQVSRNTYCDGYLR